MKKFYWVEKDYQNASLNSLAQRVTEYNTVDLILNNYEVLYSAAVPTDGSEFEYIGKLQVGEAAKNFNYSVSDIFVVNDMFNYNLYFPTNTEPKLNIPNELVGTFDCLVSLASGNMLQTSPADIGLTTNNHYVIDISPTAIHKTIGLYKESATSFTQLDIFNTNAVKEFVENCKGTKGFFVVSNCFRYIISSLLYDVKLRLKLQNDFINVLANDRIDWYVTMFTADGEYYKCVRAKDIQNKILDNRFKVLPWIK